MKKNKKLQGEPALQDKDGKTEKDSSIKNAVPECPEEYEEDRSMNIRMHEQPFVQSKKNTDNKQNNL